jgi:hypothetical protein
VTIWGDGESNGTNGDARGGRQRRRVDGLGDDNENYFRGSYRNDVVDCRWRCDVGRNDQEGILLEEYHVADWSMNEGP